MDQQHRWRGLALMLLRLAALLLLLPAHASAQFFQPGEAREVWRVGDVKTIEYSTTMTHYTITIYQEVLPKRNAVVGGPMLVHVIDGPATQFKWEVQLYDFNLTFSNVFYLWLREGGPDNRGNLSAQSISTPYFNITDEGLASSSSTTLTATSPSTTLLSSSSSPVTSFSDAPSSTMPLADSPVPTASTADGNASTADDSTEASASSTTENGLPVGAQAGIGVGVSVVGLTCIVCAVMWFRHLKKKRQLLADLQQLELPPMGDDPWKPLGASPGNAPFHAAEMDDANRRQVVEMDTGRYRVEMPSPYGPGDGRPAELGGHWP